VAESISLTERGPVRRRPYPHWCTLTQHFTGNEQSSYVRLAPGSTVLCSVRTPRMNAIAERWIGGCRRELLDGTLIWNQSHLRQILRGYETHHNQHRPHRFLHGAAPLKPLPEPVDLEQCRVRRHARVGSLINDYRLVA
jgi:hypothetical protein